MAHRRSFARRSRHDTLRPFAAPHKAVKQYYLERKSKLLSRCDCTPYEAFMILALTKHYLISFKVAERQYSCRTPRLHPYVRCQQKGCNRSQCLTSEAHLRVLSSCVDKIPRIIAVSTVPT